MVNQHTKNFSLINSGEGWVEYECPTLKPYYRDGYKRYRFSIPIMIANLIKIDKSKRTRIRLEVLD